MPGAPKLVSLKVSPWSERAKWALDHHGIEYRVIEHVPVVGERRLRKLVGPAKPRATVPVLVDGDEVLSESWDIAAHADRIGRGPKLIPADLEGEVRRWASVADTAMQSARALVLAGMLAHPKALDDGGPPFVPRWLRPGIRPVTRLAMRAFARKYDLDLRERERHLAGLRVGLDALRARTSAGAQYLLESFSYADIAMATLLQGVAPVADRFLRLSPATRLAWAQPELASEYQDLVTWRDQVYQRHRRNDGS